MRKEYKKHTSKDKRYETDYCDIIYFPNNSIIKLRDSYHDEYMPDFIKDLLLHVPQCIDRKLIKQCPELFTWTCKNDYFIRPNIPKYKEDDLLTNFKSSWKKYNALHLIAWYVPSIFYTSIMESFDKQNYKIFRKKICDIERIINHEFLATPLDLEPRHLSSLLALRSQVLKELNNTYGLKNTNDARLYFHIYNMTEYASLHLQIRYNTTLHPAEEPRTLDLDQVIAWLSAGKSVIECLTEENRKAYFFDDDNPCLIKHLKKIPNNIAYSRVENPFKNYQHKSYKHSQMININSN